MGLQSWFRRKRKGILSDKELLALTTEILDKPENWKQAFKRRQILDYLIYIKEDLVRQNKNYTGLTPDKLRKLATSLAIKDPDPEELKMTLNRLVEHLHTTMKQTFFHKPFTKAIATASAVAVFSGAAAANPNQADAATQAYAGGLKQEYSQQQNSQKQYHQDQANQNQDINPNFQMPSDALLTQWMNQPVEETLRGTDYTQVNDNNYQAEVFGSDKPVMVLFYVDSNKLTGVNGSRGLASLTATLHYKFPGIKLCMYKITDGARSSKADYDRVMAKYPLKETPTLAFYNYEKGTVKHMGNKNGGINTLKTFQKNFSQYNSVIPKYMLK